jgi:hypothetical protein
MTRADRQRVSEQFNLFLPYLADPPLRDQREVMERPFFSAAGHQGRQAEATAPQALPDRLLSNGYRRGSDCRRQALPVCRHRPHESLQTWDKTGKLVHRGIRGAKPKLRTAPTRPPGRRSEWNN